MRVWSKGPGVEAALVEPVAEKGHAVGAGEDDPSSVPEPVLGRIHSRPVVGRADVQEGQRRYGGSFGFEALLEGAGLFAAAGDE